MTIKNIPVGYKNSPLGIIPQEWETVRLKDCFSISAGGDVQKDCFSETSSLQYKYPVYSNSLSNHGLYGFTSCPRHKANSITITGRGALGHAEYRKTDFDAIVRLLVLTPRIPLNGQFVTEYINHRKPFFFESTGVPQLTAPQIESLRILFPPLPEQKKIAEILSTWDKAIEKQTQLIQKLELRKKGLMQQLLTGKKRLPGFTDEWKKVKLGEVTTFLSCNTFSREQMNNVCGNWKNVHYGDILVKYSSIVDISRDKDSIPYVNDTIEYSPKDYVASGDIVMADTAEDEMVGRACEFTNVGEEKIISGLHTILIRPIILFAPIFLGYYLNSREYHKQILSIMQGIKVYSITKEALKNTTIKYPDIQEQTAIANILSSCDEEIRLAQGKLATIKEQKKGLMQVLLTGKKRVKI